LASGEWRVANDGDRELHILCVTGLGASANSADQSASESPPHHSL